MDFARKQLEKFGWKDGTGLGKNEQGIVTAIKPTLKVGKEGMGFDLSKELVDTWWTRAYDDSLKRINIDEKDGNDTVGVSLQEDEDDGSLQGGGLVKDEERPFIRMKKRMMKATFTTFSKGAVLSNGELIPETEDSNEDSRASDGNAIKNTVKSLTDEELFKACGGRTAHKGARFGLKLTGKLARIAAQEEALKALVVKSQSKAVKVKPDPEEPVPIPEEDVCNSSKKKKDKKKKSKKHEEPDPVPTDNDNQDSEMEVPPSSTELEAEPENSDTTTETEQIKLSKKKQKKHKKRKYEELQDEEEWNTTSDPNNDLISETPADNVELESEPKKKKKSKKQKRSKDDHESSQLISS